MTSADTIAFIGSTTDPVAGSLALAGLTLAIVFLAAAVLKLISPSTTVEEFTSLGVPRPRSAARIVPIAELAIAVLLFVRPTIGGPIAAITLIGFTVVLVRVVRSGRTVSCGCLGALDRGPVSTSTISRNGVFIALATVIGVGARTVEPTGSALTLPTASLTVQLLVVAGSAGLIALMVAQLILLRRRIGRIWSVALAGETDRAATTDDIADQTDQPAIDSPTSGSPLEVLAT